MKISFYGACGEVTGSCYLVQTEQSRFLVDCGMFQGGKFAEDKNFEPFGFDPKSIDFVVLTHVHMDHIGRLPRLYKEGFRGKIYSTEPTADFARIMLLDSARVIFEEALANNALPLYLDKYVNELMKQFVALSYRKQENISADIKITMRDAGHILGSAIVEIVVADKAGDKKIVFSGDLGNPPAPLVEDTEFISGADYVVMESTYGGIIHEPAEMRIKMLHNAVVESVGKGGVLMIPAFALERTQEVLYEMNYLVENKKVPPVSMFVDSPLAISATDIYKKYVAMYDKESRALIEAGDDLFNFRGLVYTKTREESKKINQILAPKIILAGSGMCTGGRIVYHLQRYLGSPQNHLLIIGYQVEGSLGRKLLDGAKVVEIGTEKIEVKAKVSAIGAYSSHADQPKLLHWVKMMSAPKPKKVFVVHGEEKRRSMLVDGLRQKLGIDAVMPRYGESFDL
ncbi:MAG: MBL fold metallo-hydrolase [Patescibacteria group bacterium]|jgi:metallo-beta-lactamase family protein